MGSDLRSGHVVVHRSATDAERLCDRRLIFTGGDALAEFLHLRRLQDGGAAQMLATGLGPLKLRRGFMTDRIIWTWANRRP